jgi:ribosomal protein L23
VTDIWWPSLVVSEQTRAAAEVQINMQFADFFPVEVLQVMTMNVAGEQHLLGVVRLLVPSRVT